MLFNIRFFKVCRFGLKRGWAEWARERLWFPSWYKGRFDVFVGHFSCYIRVKLVFWCANCLVSRQTKGRGGGAQSPFFNAPLPVSAPPLSFRCQASGTWCTLELMGMGRRAGKSGMCDRILLSQWLIQASTSRPNLIDFIYHRVHVQPSCKITLRWTSIFYFWQIHV